MTAARPARPTIPLAAMVTIGAAPPAEADDAAAEAELDAPEAALLAPSLALEAALLADSEADEAADEADSDAEEAPLEADPEAPEALEAADSAEEAASPVRVVVIVEPAESVVTTTNPNRVLVADARLVIVLPSVVNVVYTPSVDTGTLPVRAEPCPVDEPAAVAPDDTEAPEVAANEEAEAEAELPGDR